MPHRLPSYVRAHRKRLELSQRELSFLLGLTSQAVISQHESLVRLPKTKALLKYETLFGGSVSELFPKLKREADAELAARVSDLMGALEGKSGAGAARKVRILGRLLARLEPRKP